MTNSISTPPTHSPILRNYSPAFNLILAGLLFGNTLALHAADSWTQEPAPSAKNFYDAAKNSLEANQWKPALANLQKAAALDPDNADIHNLLGYSYRKQGNLEEAFAHYEIALRLNPGHLGAHEYVGETYLLAKDLVNAENHLATLESLCGKTCAQSRELAAAIEIYKNSR